MISNVYHTGDLLIVIPGPDDANEASVSTSTSRRQLVTFPVASICACLATTLADKGVAIASQFADSM